MVNISQWEIVKIAFQYSLKICLQNKSGKTKIINKKNTQSRSGLGCIYCSHLLLGVKGQQQT